MPQFDMPLSELRTYRAVSEEPDDFDEFWDRTLSHAASVPAETRFTEIATPLTTVTTTGMRFTGWGGQRVDGWLLMPTSVSGPLPVIVQFGGYGSRHGQAHQDLFWSSAGFAHLTINRAGDITRGILDPRQYFYRGVIADCVRAIDEIREHPAVDAERVIVHGGSQGGGLAIAATALRSAAVRGVIAEVPFLCDMEHAIAVTESEPYGEVVRYLRANRGDTEAVLRTLSYVDGVAFAARIRTPALFAAALMDDVCPPSTVFGAYNALAGEKSIEVYPYNRHDGGGPEQQLVNLAFARSLTSVGSVAHD